MHDLDIPTVVALIVVCFAGSALSTVVGFGMNIILLSVFQFLLPPVQLVAMVTILGLANASIRAVDLRRVDTGGITGRVLVAGVIGVPLGAALLFTVREDYLRLFFSGLVLLSALMLMVPGAGAEALQAPRQSKIGQWLFGALGGFTTGAAGMPGPPVVWCALRQAWEKSQAHAVFARFFVVTGVAALAILWRGGAYDRSTVLVSLALVPVIAPGVFVGTKIRRRVSQAHFRRIASWGLIVLAVAAAANTLLGMN